MLSGIHHSMWPMGGEPHDTSALALLRMQDHCRYLSILGIFAAATEAFVEQAMHKPGQESKDVQSL